METQSASAHNRSVVITHLNDIKGTIEVRMGDDVCYIWRSQIFKKYLMSSNINRKSPGVYVEGGKLSAISEVITRLEAYHARIRSGI